MNKEPIIEYACAWPCAWCRCSRVCNVACKNDELMLFSILVVELKSYVANKCLMILVKK